VSAADRRPGPHVLVARLDSDGDVLLAGPAVRAVAAGAGQVSLLVGPRGRAAAALLPGVDRILVHRAEWIDPEPGPLDRDRTLGLVARVAGLGVDQAIVLTSFHQSPLPLALLLRLAGVPVVAAISEDYPGSLLDVRHRVGDDVHEVERALSLVATLGYALPPGDDGALRVTRSGGLPVACAALRPYVVVHPGASVAARAWAPDRCGALVSALVAGGRRVVVTGAATERTLTARVAGPPRPAVVDLGGYTTLPELAEVLAAADAIVVGNTGPAHLAAAVGTPVVSLHAPTVPAVRWRPRGPHVLLGDQAIPCAGCRARVCPVAGHPCLDLTTGDVVAAVEMLTRRRRADGRDPATARPPPRPAADREAPRRPASRRGTPPVRRSAGTPGAWQSTSR
jgi:ADP-heptose:LPS heptosyltransferase